MSVCLCGAVGVIRGKRVLRISKDRGVNETVDLWESGSRIFYPDGVDSTVSTSFPVTAGRRCRNAMKSSSVISAKHAGKCWVWCGNAVSDFSAFEHSDDPTSQGVGYPYAAIGIKATSVG